MASGLRTPADLATAAPQALVSTSVASAEQATMVFRFTLSNLRHCDASPRSLAGSHLNLPAVQPAACAATGSPGGRRAGLPNYRARDALDPSDRRPSLKASEG